MNETAEKPPSKNLILACISDHPKAILVLRLARKRAQERNLQWRAVYIDTPANAGQSDDGQHERMLRLMTMAEQMGGEVIQVEAETIERGMENLLEKEAGQVALVIVGHSENEGRFRGLRALPWMQMVRMASQYTQVEIVPLSGQHYRRSLGDRFFPIRSIRLRYLLYALVAVSIAYLNALGLQALLPPALFRINDQNVVLLFMIACAFTAGRFGLLPGLVASVASFLTVNYFFTVPYHVLKINTVTDILNMSLFLGATLLISLFTSQTRDFAQKAAKRELSTQALFTLYRIASDAFSREQALDKLQQKLERMLEMDVAFFLPDLPGDDHVEPAFPTNLVLDEKDKRALNVCWTEMKTTGIASPMNPGTSWRFEPMISPAGEVGVLGVRPRGRTHLDAWFGRLLSAIADQTAAVLEHIELEHSMAETRIREEREKLRSMLLSSVSHDFKTPLAGIIGALSVHRSLGEKLAPSKREELINAAIEEAQRLDSFITNILDITRLESGNIQFKKEWHRPADMIENVTKRLRHRLRAHKLQIHACDDTIEVQMDVMMTEQVLQNILDNAGKYTKPDTLIEISCRADRENGFVCEVRDHGGGLPPDKINRAFDKYARLQKKDTQVAGTGLGLAISKAIMEAQNGWITVANHQDGGALFTFSLPQWRHAETSKPLAL